MASPTTQAPAKRRSRQKGKTTLWTRRDFFSLSGWAGIAFVLASGLLGFLRFMFPRVLFEPPMIFTAGQPTDYLVGEVSTKYKKAYRVWIIRRESGIFAMLAICTHLGCTPNWIPNKQAFKCPCHGSGFYLDGTNFEGPAPRPLDRVRISLTAEGTLLVDKSRVYYMRPVPPSPDEQYPESILKV
ncbi:MAG: ubiquinol-cytochrome c reductase iron-sulfur subunit [Nitrospinota bacterium]|nr:MAG: ubiquinol-cytochrome c reductase iron-sulfur subunit [Nitrospinota bacterium]